MLINWCRRAAHRMGLLLRRLVRGRCRTGLDRVCAADRHHRDRGNPGVPDDSIEDGRRVSGLERQRAGDLGDPAADVGRSPWRATPWLPTSAALGGRCWETLWRRVNVGCSGGQPRACGGGVRVGSPDPAHSAAPDARRRTRRFRVPRRATAAGTPASPAPRDGRSASRSSSCRLPWAGSARVTSSCWARLAPGWVR